MKKFQINALKNTQLKNIMGGAEIGSKTQSTSGQTNSIERKNDKDSLEDKDSDPPEKGVIGY